MAWQEFYREIFSAESTDDDLQNILLRQLESKLDPSVADLCEGFLTRDECLTALKGMTRNKTPGFDDLPLERRPKGSLLLGSDWSRSC